QPTFCIRISPKREVSGHVRYTRYRRKLDEVIWRYSVQHCCSVALKTIGVAGARGIGMQMVSVLLPRDG
ncbi:unnamed protein product, partial [Ascophyllum nodosum]